MSTSPLIWDGRFNPEPTALREHAPEDEVPRVDDGASTHKPEQKTATRAEFNFRLLGDLMNEPDVPVDWLLDGLLVQGTLGLLAAKPKTGKSVFARGLALAVAQGAAFLGRKTTQGSVLYLCLEERTQDVRQDFKLMGATGNEPLRIDDTGAPGTAGLVAAVQQHKPTLVVIDPLQRLLPIEDGNSYAQTYKAFSPLIECASKTNTHILALHHSSSKVEREAIASPLGSTGLSAVAASVLLLRRHGDQRSLETVQRIGRDLKRVLLCFDESTKILSLGGSVAEAVSNRASEMVLDLLARQGELTQAEIREQCKGIGSQHIRDALTTLLRNAKVQSVGSGKRGDPMRYSLSLEDGFGGFSGFSYTSDHHAKPETRTLANAKNAVDGVAEEGGFGNRLSIVKPENQKSKNATQPITVIGEKVVLSSQVVSEDQEPLTVLKNGADGPSRFAISTALSHVGVLPQPDGVLVTSDGAPLPASESLPMPPIFTEGNVEDSDSSGRKDGFLEFTL